MQNWLRSKLLWGVLLASGVGLALCCLGGGPNSPLPKADNAFLSYLQATHALARQILDPPPLLTDENRKEQIAKACEELEKLQADVQSLPPSELQRLALAEKALVSQTNEAWAEISRRHTQSPSFPEADWPRLEKAFQLCRELNLVNR